MFTHSITTKKGTTIKIGVKNKMVIGHTKIGTNDQNRVYAPP